MGVDHAAVLLLLLTAGCARVEHDTGALSPRPSRHHQARRSLPLSPQCRRWT
jgi:hypothetical protein